MIGGGTARTPHRQLSLVSGVNGGIAALSKSIAEQGIVDGIHVNLVQPGMVKTSRRQKLFEKWAAPGGHRDRSIH
jgi:3-oxoacyl-[acyl-carrier protein] reductase